MVCSVHVSKPKEQPASAKKALAPIAAPQIASIAPMMALAPKATPSGPLVDVPMPDFKLHSDARLAQATQLRNQKLDELFGKSPARDENTSVRGAMNLLQRVVPTSGPSNRDL
jgi:hypothetical protein